MIDPQELEKRVQIEDIFAPKIYAVTFRVQQLFPFRSNPINSILRDFYESLGRAVFSGDLRDRKYEIDIEPDLTDQQIDRYIEVKATGHTRRVMLKDDQITKYKKLQASSPQSTRIYFMIFRYGTRGIEAKTKGYTQDQIIEYLTKDTKFMLGLPFSIISHIHQQGYKGGYVTRCETERSNPCTNFNSLLIDSFFLTPEQTIKDLQLDTEDYLIRKTKLGLGLTINGYEIAPFPMTLVKDSEEYHQRWTSQHSHPEVPF